MNAVDAAVLLAAVLAVLIGWRVGLLQGFLGFLGFVAGVAVVLWLVPAAAPDWRLSGWRIALVAALVLCGGFLGQALGALIGGWLRLRVDNSAGRKVDSALGAGLALATTAVAVWALVVVSGVLVPGWQPASTSRIVAGIDQRMPVGARQALDGLAGAVHDATLPLVMGGLLPGTSTPPPPDTSNVTPAVAAALDSVVKVSGPRPDCGNGATGSGYVSTPEHVTTNAHVVAAMSSPRVTTAQGKSYAATIVGFDPRLDVAVLYVPGLPLPAVPTSTAVAAGTQGVVAGYPGGGPLEVLPAVVSGTLTSGRAVGTDIYGQSPVVRDALVISADVRPGNSGGPLLGEDGTVLGLVFAQALEDDRVGYALTAAEFRELSRQAGSATSPVSAGSCPAA